MNRAKVLGGDIQPDGIVILNKVKNLLHVIVFGIPSQSIRSFAIVKDDKNADKIVL